MLRVSSRPLLLFTSTMVTLLMLHPPMRTTEASDPSQDDYVDLSAVEWAWLTATNMGVTGEPDAIYVAQIPFEQLQDLLTEEEIAQAARDTGLSAEAIRAGWIDNDLKAVYPMENEWLSIWTVVDLIGGIQYRSIFGGSRLEESLTYDRVRLFFVKGSLVMEGGLLSKVDQVKPWGVMVERGSKRASELKMQVPIDHAKAARTLSQRIALTAAISPSTTLKQPESLCYYCPASPCNVVLQVLTHVTGTSARLRVGDPTLHALNEFDAWSASRVTADDSLGFLEAGWMKWLCFTTAGCPRYDSWKSQYRHIWVRRRIDGSNYYLADVANTRVGNNQNYKVEQEFIGDPWYVWGWSAWVEQTKLVSVWTGFGEGTDNWYGPEAPYLGGYPFPLNGMDTTVSEARYRATNGFWYDVGYNYRHLQYEAIPPYWATFGYGSLQVGGCN